MIRSRILVFLPIVLCFVLCLCAGANTAEDEKTAKKDVKGLKELTAKVLGKAESKYREAQSTKDTVESQKEKAESAGSAVAETAAAEKDNEEVKLIAQKAESELQEFGTLYTSVKGKAEEAFNKMNELRTKARDLSKKSKEILPASGEPIGYAQVIQSAADVKSQTETLSGDIDVAARLINTADAAVWKLREGATKVQVSKYQADSIVIYSQIESVLATADNDIKSIGEKRDEITATVKVMNGKFQSAPEKFKGFLSSMCNSAESKLQTATNKLKAAQKCLEDMQERKTLVDGDLGAVKIETDEGKAKNLFSTFVFQKKFFDGGLQKIKRALQTAETSVNTANNRHEQMDQTVSQNNRQSANELKEKPKDDVPTEEVTTPIGNTEEKKTVTPSGEKPIVIQTDKPEITETAKANIIKTDRPVQTETEKPEKTDTEKPISEKSEDTMEKTSEQPVDANLDNTEQNKSAQMTDKEKQNPKDDNSELLNNDKLRKMTNNMTNNSLSGGEVQTRSAVNDSAMTVFIPLLVILVISAVLH